MGLGNELSLIQIENEMQLRDNNGDLNGISRKQGITSQSRL